VRTDSWQQLATPQSPQVHFTPWKQQLGLEPWKQ
jgi:hypothetical protein